MGGKLWNCGLLPSHGKSVLSSRKHTVQTTIQRVLWVVNLTAHIHLELMLRVKLSYTSALTTCLHNLHMYSCTFVVIYILHIKITSTVDQLAKFLLAD